ncbi:hypothetical protein MGSAQ_000557 [marine sediment metagenome]|uniref:Uncharacterized protein n=1 Tax=marine sediment metagenome TaxID=412755 RepID=A0A1B6NYP2_9ZZZZ
MWRLLATMSSACLSSILIRVRFLSWCVYPMSPSKTSVS